MPKKKPQLPDPLHNPATAMLALELQPIAPPDALKQRLMDRIAADEAARPVVEIRADQGKWRETGMPGVTVKMLYRDPQTKLMSVLLRLAPGAVYKAHRHFEAEQCLVLEGDLHWEHLEYKAGDFVVAGKGSIHPDITTRNGVTMLIITGHTEFIHAS